ncbi:MAG: hypothetical protein PHI37_00675 [Candidatus Gracilibacteria bacterium]|nr:hypothetical protein [Candidatus Gracilibacteria bacterium]
MGKEIDLEAFRKAGLSLEEIDGIKRGLKDVEDGNVYEETEFYSNLEKRIFSKRKTYV